MTRIYVGNLPLSANEEDLRALFATYGKVQTLSLANNRETDIHKGYGFVEMSSDDAAKAMQCLDGKATDCTDSPYVDTEQVVGKVLVLVWPRDRFGWVHRPDFFDDIPDAS